MPDTCPVCGKTDWHCYRGEPIDPATWHTLADTDRERRYRDLIRGAAQIEAWTGKVTPNTMRLRDLAARMLRGEENYP